MSCVSGSTAWRGQSRSGRMARTEAEQEKLLRRLRAALELLSPEDIAKLIDEARAEARRHVKHLLTSAMTESMLAQIEQELRPARQPEKRPEPAPTSETAGVYVYGVVPASCELPDELHGIDPISSPRLLPDGDLAAVVSKV